MTISPAIHLLRPLRIFESAEDLETYMQALNEVGHDRPTLLLFDNTSQPFMAYGEDRSDCEYMHCWVVTDDPWSNDRDASDYCDECGQPEPQHNPLSSLHYPVMVLWSREFDPGPYGPDNATQRLQDVLIAGAE